MCAVHTMRPLIPLLPTTRPRLADGGVNQPASPMWYAATASRQQQVGYEASTEGTLVTKANVRDLVVNRRAKFEYDLLDTFEAGISLVGSEVKSIRAGKANLAEAFVKLTPAGAFLQQCHISPYTEANRLNHDPIRSRQLLLHRPELLKLRRGLLQKGMTIVPLRLYLKGSLVKLELALGKGRKLHDKRHALKKRQADLDMRRG
ncbi:MAG: SsrA-binding protein [Myxococcota bacterium]|jgi:SsrA-binding protein